MKKFTKGCAVDVRHMGELPYGEVMFNAIKKIGQGFDDDIYSNYICIGEKASNYFLKIDSDNAYIMGAESEDKGILTPTEILGEHLVKAIEEGYTPWFEGDEIPSGEVHFIDDEGDCGTYTPHRANWGGLVIAYTVIDKPSIESTILSAKVSDHNHYFKDVSNLETIDVYRVIDLFQVVNPCHQHALKKILCCGQRGAKDAAKDTQEAVDSLNRALEMMREDDGRRTAAE